VLVLPSLAEAFGLVVGEALSTGTAVIVSQNCGAADLIIDGFNGYVVPIRSAEAIAARLVELADDSEKLSALKHNAVFSAGRTTWTPTPRRCWMQSLANPRAVQPEGALQKARGQCVCPDLSVHFV